MPNTIPKNRVFNCPTHMNRNQILAVCAKLFVDEEGILGNVTVGGLRPRDGRPKERQPFPSVVAHCKTQGSNVRKEEHVLS